MILLLILCVVWIVGAILSLKTEAMLCNQPTDWSSLGTALVFWVPVAILLLRTPHCVRHFDRINSDDEYRY